MVSELSVLIPVYNYNVLPLVSELLKQCRALTSNFEICLYDDGSKEKIRIKHRYLNEEPEVRYVEMRQNIGRSAIRNRLAHDAKYKYLLFLDNDSALPDDQFIKRYWESLADADVLIGGTIYENKPPSDIYMLRWRYGKAREEKIADLRNKNPFQSLTINNMLIRKDVYLKHPLCLEIDGYGHEDTKFGLELLQAGIKLKHIDNPVIHLGLEPAADFIRKTKQAVRNLYQLYETKGNLPESKLLQSYEWLRKAKMRRAFLLFFNAIKSPVLTNLKSADPSLKYFDLYKLYLFTRLALENKNA